MPTTITIVPWTDPFADTLGYDPRSLYAETFWLPTLGPTALLLLRHLAGRFDVTPRGLELEVAATSKRLGVGDRDGSSSPIVRTLARLEQFELACTDPQSPTIAVRRNLPPLHTRHLRKLPPELQQVHEHWAQVRLTEPPHADATRSARRLALTLLEQGHDADHVERVLGATGYHPAVAAASARWATECNRSADPTSHLDAVS